MTKVSFFSSIKKAVLCFRPSSAVLQARVPSCYPWVQSGAVPIRGGRYGSRYLVPVCAEFLVGLAAMVSGEGCDTRTSLGRAMVAEIIGL